MTEPLDPYRGSGVLPPAPDSAQADDAIEAAYRAMPLPGPSAGLAGRIMATIRADDAEASSVTIGALVSGPPAAARQRIDMALAAGMALGVVMTIALMLLYPAEVSGAIAAAVWRVWDGAAGFASQMFAVDWTVGTRAMGSAAAALPSATILGALLMTLSGLWWALNMWTARCARQ